MEKTFREVIADIKVGEVWENSNRKITINDIGEIFIKDKQKGLVCFNPTVLYRLERKKYTFEEAISDFKEGKEIESLVTKKKYNIEFDYVNRSHLCNIIQFTVEEIIGKWYIND